MESPILQEFCIPVPTEVNAWLQLGEQMQQLSCKNAVKTKRVSLF